MKTDTQHTVPCPQCPWRRDSKKGELGGISALTYADAVAENSIPQCHVSQFCGQNHLCAGAAATASSAMILPYDKPAMEFRKKVGRREDCFANPSQFYAHHANGKRYVRAMIRRAGELSRSEVNAFQKQSNGSK